MILKKREVNKNLVIVLIVVLVLLATGFSNDWFGFSKRTKLAPPENIFIGYGAESPNSEMWKGHTGNAYSDKDYFDEGDLPTLIVERTAPEEVSEEDPQFILKVMRNNVPVYILIDKAANCIDSEVHKMFPSKAEWTASTRNKKQFDVYWGYLKEGEYSIPHRFSGCNAKTAPRYNYIFVAGASLGKKTPDPQPTPEKPSKTPKARGVSTPPSKGGLACGTEIVTGEPEKLEKMCSLGICPDTPDGKRQICKADAAKKWCGCQPVEKGGEAEEDVTEETTGKLMVEEGAKEEQEEGISGFIKKIFTIF